MENSDHGLPRTKKINVLTDNAMKVWQAPQVTQLDVVKTRGGSECTKEESVEFNIKYCS